MKIIGFIRQRMFGGCQVCGRKGVQRYGFSIPNSHRPAVVYVCKECYETLWRQYYDNTKQETGKE